jgi:pimeloyl-ACP methyl ester carboxylesterase
VLGLLGACGGEGTERARTESTSPTRPSAAEAEPPAEPEVLDEPPGLPAGWAPEPLAWASCSQLPGGECATLAVPLDWDTPEGPTITLALGRFRAEGERIGSLLLNPGGPGGSGLEYLSYDPVGPELVARFDRVSWDPRGVGQSSPLRCTAGIDQLTAVDPDPDDAAEQRALDRSGAEVAASCGELDGQVLAHVGTVDVARDLEAIRLALGAEPLNYLGFSYGTHIGQVYAELFPDSLRAMVLDGVVDPALGYEEFLLGQTEGFDRAFAAAAEQCAAAGPSSCGVDDLGAAYDEVLRRVDAAPLGGAPVPVGPAVLSTAAISTSYGTDGWRELGPALAAASAGDGAPLWQLARSYYDAGAFTSYAAVVCLDSRPPRGPDAYRSFADRARGVSERFGGAVANELVTCATWPEQAPDPEPLVPVAADAPPILVVGSTGDAATPYENAVAVADRMPSSVLLTAEQDGHTAYGSNSCVSRAVEAYLVQLVLPAPDSRC